jgi:hypothetical protein
VSNKWAFNVRPCPYRRVQKSCEFAVLSTLRLTGGFPRRARLSRERMQAHYS